MEFLTNDRIDGRIYIDSFLKDISVKINRNIFYPLHHILFCFFGHIKSEEGKLTDSTIPNNNKKIYGSAQAEITVMDKRGLKNYNAVYSE